MVTESLGEFMRIQSNGAPYGVIHNRICCIRAYLNPKDRHRPVVKPAPGVSISVIKQRHGRGCVQSWKHGFDALLEIAFRLAHRPSIAVHILPDGFEIAEADLQNCKTGIRDGGQRLAVQVLPAVCDQFGYMDLPAFSLPSLCRKAQIIVDTLTLLR
jgi:hypothetical protein